MSAIIAALRRAADVIELFDDATMKADYMLDAGECASIIRALADSPDYAEPSLVWMRTPPPKRGVYRVRSDGPTANRGFRYWFGDRWGSLCSQRKWAVASAKNGPGRKLSIRYPIMWEMKTKAKP